MITFTMAGVFVGATNIQNKIKFGLGRAFDALGDPTSPPVFVVKSTQTGGGSTPSNPPIFTDEDVLLVNAVFDDVSKDMIDSSLIKLGDSVLTSDSDVEINQGEIIKSDGKEWIVITVLDTSPFGIPLAYESIVRLK